MKTGRAIQYFPLALITIIVFFRDSNTGFYDRILVENGPVETTQFLLFFVSALCFGWIAYAESGTARWLVLAFAAGALFLAGEEISWGQRMFGLRLPENLRAANLQGELNLHNLPGVRPWTRLATALAALYGLLGPWLAARNGSTLRRALVPSKELCHYFWPILLFLIYGYVFVDAARDCRPVSALGRGKCLVTWNEQEWMELFTALALFLHAASIGGLKFRRSEGIAHSPPDSRDALQKAD